MVKNGINLQLLLGQKNIYRIYLLLCWHLLFIFHRILHPHSMGATDLGARDLRPARDFLQAVLQTEELIYAVTSSMFQSLSCTVTRAHAFSLPFKYTFVLAHKFLQ